MPEYLYILRQASVASIYVLFALVLILIPFKGRIKSSEFAALFYLWLPIAVITQFAMTYYRLQSGESNFPIMNVYLIVEFIFFVSILLMIKKRTKSYDYKK